MSGKSLGLLLVFIIISCKPRTGESDFKSSAPILRNNSLARFPYGNLAACEQHESLPGLTKTKQYLRLLANRIMRLSPDVFQGPFDPSQICIRLYGEGLTKPAFAGMNDTVDDGLITINPFTLKKFSSERQLAFMLSHELGHVVGLHKTPRAVYRPLLEDPNIRPIIKKQMLAEIAFHRKVIKILKHFQNVVKDVTPDFSRRISLELQHSKFILTLLDPESEYIEYFQTKRFREPEGYELFSGFFEYYEAHPKDATVSNLRKELTVELIKLKEAHELSNQYFILEESDIRDSRGEFLDAIEALPGGYKRFAEIQTWQEVEADEVGLVFYLRAGYSMDNMLAYFENYETSCWHDIEQGKVPERLNIQRVLDNRLDISYTEACWRVYNLKKRQPNILKKLYPDLFQAGQAKVINNPGLAEAFEEIEAYAK